MTLYPAHPLAEIFPMLDEVNLRTLSLDIQENGQFEPILLLDGKVLDGRNRQAACALVNVEPVYEQFKLDDPLTFVLSKNLHRRHMNEAQRALAAASIVDWEIGVNQYTADIANVQTRRAAEKLTISERSVHSAKRIREKGSSELLAAIRSGTISIRTGESLSELEHSEQTKVLRQEKKEILAAAKQIRAEQAKVRHAVKVATLSMIAERGRETAPGKVQKLYPVIYADPPWAFETYSPVTGGDKGAENHYPTMDIGAICRLFKEIGDPATPNAMLYLWVTTPMLKVAITEVLPAWGFEYVSSQVWDKCRIGTGYHVRDQHETLLIAKRGKGFSPVMGEAPPSIYTENKTRHSAKPIWFAEQLERLYPELPKLELFCRRPRKGWDAWGFEAKRQDEAEPETLSVPDEQYEIVRSTMQKQRMASPNIISKLSLVPYEKVCRVLEQLEQAELVSAATSSGRRTWIGGRDV